MPNDKDSARRIVPYYKNNRDSNEVMKSDLMGDSDVNNSRQYQMLNKLQNTFQRSEVVPHPTTKGRIIIKHTTK